MANYRQLADDYISSYFSGSYVYVAIGHDDFKERLGRLIMTKMLPQYDLGNDIDYAIVQFLPGYAEYSNTASPIRQKCITIPTHILNSVDTSGAVLGNDLMWRFLLDVRSPAPALVIPMHLFIPYAGHARNRTESELARTNMIPHFFITTSRDVGVHLLGGHEQLDPNRPFSCQQRTSLKIKFGWPGYDSYEGQIQYNGAPGGGPTNISSRRLAILVAGQVVAFLNKAMDGSVVHRERTAFDIGRNPGRVQARDLILVGVLFVSPGSIMPLLQLRPGFVTGHGQLSNAAY